MRGTILDAEKTGIRHIKNYILPFLSGKQKIRVAKNLSNHMTIHTENGEYHEVEFSHELASRHDLYDVGTQIKVTGVHYDITGKIYIDTVAHGVIPLSRVAKPSSLKKAPVTKKSFDIEKKIAEFLDGKPAGSSKNNFDFQYPYIDNGKAAYEAGEKNVPIIRGESKFIKGKMGQSVLRHRDKKWEFSNKKLGKKMNTAKIDGRTILDHLGNNHPDGKISESYAVSAPKGMSRHYLKTSGVNVLHIHNDKTDHGTTFTIGDTRVLMGNTALGHLTGGDIDRLDGKLLISKTTSGRTTILHRPEATIMKLYADMSSGNVLHRDLTQQSHCIELMLQVDHIVRKAVS